MTVSPATNDKPCFAHRHMSPQDFGLWNYLRAVSHKSGLVHFDGRQITTQFHGVSKSTIYRVRDSLISGGWLVMTKGPKKTLTGLYSSAEYQALSHDEWAASHPGFCNEFSPANTGKSRVINTGDLQMHPAKSASPTGGTDQSHRRDSPVPRAGHNLVLDLNRSRCPPQAPDRAAKDLPSNFEANASNKQHARSLGLDIQAVTDDFVMTFGIVGNKRKNWQAVLRKFIDQVSCKNSYAPMNRVNTSASQAPQYGTLSENYKAMRERNP